DVRFGIVASPGTAVSPSLALTTSGNANVAVGYSNPTAMAGAQQPAVALGASSIGGNLQLTAAGDLKQTAGTVSVTGVATIGLANGGLTQSGTAVLKAGSLAFSAANSSVLAQSGNDVGTLAASVSGANQDFSYTDANSFALGTVGGLSGLSVNRNASLKATAGSVTQTGGDIKAAGLAVTASQSTSLTTASNDVGTLAASMTAANQSFS